MFWHWRRELRQDGYGQEEGSALSGLACAQLDHALAQPPVMAALPDAPAKVGMVLDRFQVLQIQPPSAA